MLKKLQTLRNKLLGAMAAILALAILLSFLPTTSLLKGAYAEDAFSKTSVEITNASFGMEEAGSASLSSPTSWTGKVLGESGGKGNTIDGVVDLTPSVFNTAEIQEATRLNEYDENKNSIPKSAPSSPDDENKVLLINTVESEVAYGYTSNSFSLDPNSYYKLSVWVLTGNFTSGGAAIRLSGLRNDVCFSGIDTHDYLRHVGYTGDFSDINNNRDRKYGWVNYSFFIETSTMRDSTVTLRLSVGDAFTFEKNGVKQNKLARASGYALFDEIKLYKYAPNDFAAERASATNKQAFEYPDKKGDSYYTSDDGTTTYYSESNADFLSIAENGDLLSSEDAGFAANEVGSFDRGINGWESVSGSITTGSLVTGLFDEEAPNFGLKDYIPHSPNGMGDKVALISSYNERKDSFAETAVGFQTERAFTIERHKHYRLGVWVNTFNGKVAKAAISGEDYRGLNVGVSPSNPEYGKGQLRVESDFEEPDATNAARNRWKEISFFIKGSAFRNYQIRLELWLGSKEEKKGGVAIFDTVRIEEITSTEYRDYSGKGKSVVFDNIPETAGDISNGLFNEIEDDPNYVGLPTPRGWSMVVAGKDETTGMSRNVPDEYVEDYVISGIVSSDAHSVSVSSTKTYEQMDEKIYSLDTHKYTDSVSNLLMIMADDTTIPANGSNGVAVGYRSPNFNVGSNSIFRADVTMCVDATGYGANIVLKDGDEVLTTIEKITDTAGRYKTFTIYIQTGYRSLTSPRIEIWLGLYDRTDNRQKLSKGTVFVDSVTVEQLTVTASAANDDEDDDDDDENEDESKKKELTEEEQQQNADAEETFRTNALSYADNPDNGSFSVYTGAYDNLFSFDQYDTSFVKTPYNFTLTNGSAGSVTYGIFDGTAIESNAETNAEAQADLYWKGGYSQEGADGKYVLMIKNTASTYSKVKSNVTYHLMDGSYYKITVKAKVSIPSEQDTNNYKGAFISISGGTDEESFSLDDIRSSATVLNIAGETDSFDTSYKEFVIYFRTHGVVSDKPEKQVYQDYYLEFGIGGPEIDQYAKGTMLIAGITFETTTNSEVEEAQKLIESFGSLKTPFVKYVNLAPAEEDESEEEKKEETKCDMSGDWYIYSSILLIVAIVVAVIAVVARYFARKRKLAGADPESKKLSYDRTTTLLKLHNERNKGETSIDINAIKETYDQFDEDAELENAKAKRDELEAQAISEEYASFIPEDAVIDENTPAAAGDEIVEEAPAGETAEETSEETAETTEETTEEISSEETAEEIEPEPEVDVDYNEIVDFSSAARAKTAAKAKAREEEKELDRKAEIEKANMAEEEKKRAAKAKADKRKFDEWDDFDD